MLKIHFINGESIDVSDKEEGFFLQRATAGGAKFWKSRETGTIVFFNSPAIAYVEMPDFQRKTVAELAPKRAEAKVVEDLTEAQQKESEIEAARKKLEDDFMARANCKHKDADGNTLRSIYYSETAQGKKYFPVCEFCGHRARYVGEQKVKEGRTEWTVEDLENAKLYEA